MDISLAAAALLIGIVTGLRAFTGHLVIVWSVFLGWISLAGTPFGLLDSWIARVVVTLLALGEYVADKLPSAPDRTAAAGLAARIVLGTLCGVYLGWPTVASSVMLGALGAVGAVSGAYAGLNVRRRLPSSLGISDLWVAIIEDLLAITAGFATVYFLVRG